MKIDFQAETCFHVFVNDKPVEFSVKDGIVLNEAPIPEKRKGAANFIKRLVGRVTRNKSLYNSGMVCDIVILASNEFGTPKIDMINGIE